VVQTLLAPDDDLADLERAVLGARQPRRCHQRAALRHLALGTSESWLKGRVSTFNLDSKVVPVETYAQGIERVLDGSSNVLVGELPILLDAAAPSPASGN
jgi:polar amino acid transport system substrate-binding protein